NLSLGDTAPDEQRARGRGRPRTVLEPVTGALRVDDEPGGLGERVVVTDRFDELAVSGRARVRDDDAVRRRFCLTYAAQADVNCQLGRDPPHECAVGGTPSSGANTSMIWHHARGSPGMPGKRGSRPLLAIDPICFISLRISANCLTSRFTSETVVPEPAAIRRRRDPLISTGLARSAFVIEEMI